MADGNNGGNSQSATNEELLLALRNAEATNKRTNEALDATKEQQELLMDELTSLKQTVHANRPGLSEEAKRARLAPGKYCSCVLTTLINQMTM